MCIRDSFKIFPGNNSGGIRFFIIASQLGKNFVVGYAHRDGEPCFPPHCLPEFICDLLPASKEQSASSDIQPTFVDTEGLYLIGIAEINLIYDFRIFSIFIVVRFCQEQAGAFLFCLPYGFGRSDIIPFCKLVFCQYDAVAVFRISADSHRHMFIFRMKEAFHRSVKTVAVAVKDRPPGIRQTFSFLQKYASCPHGNIPLRVPAA